jgi:DNA-binding LytR/AlgR family response regulator
MGLEGHLKGTQSCLGAAGGMMRALIVEDDVVMQRVLKTYLLHYACELNHEIKIQMMPDVRRALALLIMEEDACDVAFLAVKLPSLKGNDIFSLLVKLRPQIVDKLIFITGHRERLVSHFPELELNILDKPFRYKQLQEAMASVA